MVPIVEEGRRQALGSTCGPSYIRVPVDRKQRDLKYVAEQMGQASIKITVDIYGHLIPGGNKSAVDRLDKVFQMSSPTTT